MLGNKYNTVRASYDQNFYKQMCSLGFAYAYDNMASGVYQVNEFDLVYGHTIRLQEHYFIRLGVQASLFANYLNAGKLTFGDQYDPYTNQILPNSLENLDMSSRTFVDFSFGASFIIENTFTIGASIYHIGEPENGFVRAEDNVVELDNLSKSPSQSVRPSVSVQCERVHSLSTLLGTPVHLLIHAGI